MLLAWSCSSTWALNGDLHQAWGIYKEMLQTTPLLTKSLTSSGVMTVSDFICQKLVLTLASKHGNDKRSTPLDVVRMLRVAITGFVWSGPIQHWWFSTLDKFVTIQNPLLRLMVQLLLDAMIFSPLTISGYFSMRSILEGSGLPGAYHKLSTRFVPTLVSSWQFWPVVNAVNFGLVPLPFRVLYGNVLGLFWTGYLTFVNSKKISPKSSEI